MSRYRTMRLPTGGVIQAGLDARTRGAPASPLVPRSALVRAIVVNTYATDNPYEDDPSDPTNRVPLSRSRTSVECDVILIRSNVPLSRVPVLQTQHGVNNAHTLWVPRPCTRLIATDGSTDTGTQVSFKPVGPRGEVGTPAARFGDLDGDHVLVGFVENDHEYPVIVGAFTHERTKRLVIGARDSIGWEEGDDSTRGKPYRNEYYTSHYGTEQRINARGDLLIDTVGAFTDPATEDASGNVGQVRIRVKNSQRFTVEMDGTDVLEVWKDGGQVRIDLGEGAGQRLILGDDFKTYVNDEIITKLNNLINDYNLHKHTGVTPGVGTSAVSDTPFIPPNPQSMTDALLSDLAKTKKS